MNVSERTLLLEFRNGINRHKSLSVFFAVICVIDVFGVFPIVTLPKAIISCGFYGIIVIVVVCCFQIYTATLLGRCWIILEEMYPTVQRKNRYPYSALAEMTYGKCLSNFVNVLLDLTVFSGGIPNLIVASQNLQLLGLQISDGNINISDCYWIIIVGIILCPILWLGSPKDMKCICTLSVFMVFSVFLLTLSCLIFSYAPTNPSEDSTINDIPLWKSMLAAYGIIAFQFDIHPTVLTIQMDMKDKSKLPKTILIGFIVTLSMLGITTLAAVLKYGTNTQPSILDTLSPTIPLYFAIALTTAQLCLTSVVSNNALYQHMEDCLCISREFNSKRCILRSILMLLAVVLAQSVPRFDVVMSFIGGTLTGPLVFILPPLFYMRVLTLQKAHEERLAMQSFTNILFGRDTNSKMSIYVESKFKEDMTSSLSSEIKSWHIFNNYYFELILCILIICLSSFVTVATTYINFTNAVLSYSVSTKPCIYNVSSDLLYV